jgi:hypothetical protein
MISLTIQCSKDNDKALDEIKYCRKLAGFCGYPTRGSMDLSREGKVLRTTISKPK